MMDTAELQNITPKKEKSGTNEQDRIKQSSVDKIMLRLDELNRTELDNPEYKARRQKQRKILMGLPADYDSHLDAHLKAFFIDQKKYPQFNSEKIVDEKVLSGEIFEQLIEIEDDIFHMDPKWQEHQQTDLQKEVGEKILAVLANPDRFNLGETPGSNADMVKIIFDGTFHIYSSLEVKKHLDSRSLKQLNSFKETLSRICDVLNNLENAKNYGLDGLGKDGHKIAVDANYYQMIAVPRNVNFDNKEDTDRFISSKMSKIHRRELLEIIKNPKKVQVLKSSFTHEELEIITNHFYKRIQNKI